MIPKNKIYFGGGGGFGPGGGGGPRGGGPGGPDGFGPGGPGGFPPPPPRRRPFFGGYGYGYGPGYRRGCYIATCVYGDYDCPQVWVLRRFRDNVLSKNAAGRLFVKTYYAISPTLVKVFGKQKWFVHMWQKTLDPFVGYLHNEQGMADTPYSDPAQDPLHPKRR
jgi:hypothetical protein